MKNNNQQDKHTLQKIQFFDSFHLYSILIKSPTKINIPFMPSKSLITDQNYHSHTPKTHHKRLLIGHISISTRKIADYTYNLKHQGTKNALYWDKQKAFKAYYCVFKKEILTLQAVLRHITIY